MPHGVMSSITSNGQRIFFFQSSLLDTLSSILASQDTVFPTHIIDNCFENCFVYYCRFHITFQSAVPKFVVNLPITFPNLEVGREL